MSTLSHSVPSGKRVPFPRPRLLAAVVAQRVSPDSAALLLDAQSLLCRKGVEPTYYGVLTGVASGECSQHAADRFLSADRAVRRELQRTAA